MRICPSCRSVFPSGASVCPKDGLTLVEYSTTFPLGQTGSQTALVDRSPLDVPGDETTIEPGMMVGDYRVESLIAHGGMGMIYAAIHPLISKRVALKILSRRFAQDSEQIARFILEARSVNQIGHHNIVDIFAIGELNDGRKYLVMEYLDGLELNRVLTNVGRFRPGEVLPIYEQLCDALVAAHAKGFVHRDLKPENVTILRRHPYPFIKILDFGIAKLRGTSQTAVGTLLGTPEYMAPEQCRTGPVDARVDIYALGVMLYELVTGQKPFCDPDPLRLLALQTKERPRPPSEVAPVSPELERVVLKSLEKNPNKRQQSVRGLIEELREAIPQTLPWTASLEPPEPARESSERTKTLHPDRGGAAKTPAVETNLSGPPSVVAVRAGATETTAAARWDTHETNLLPSGEHTVLADMTPDPQETRRENGSTPVNVDTRTQIADSHPLTPIALSTGNLFNAFDAQKTTTSSVGRETIPDAEFPTPPTSAPDMREATVVDLRASFQYLASQNTPTASAISDSPGRSDDAQQRFRTIRRPTPTAIDYAPPPDVSNAQSRELVITGTIDEEQTQRRRRPTTGRQQRLIEQTATALDEPHPRDNSTTSAMLATTEAGDTAATRPRTTPAARAGENKAQKAPKRRQIATEQVLQQLAAVDADETEADDESTTTEIPKVGTDAISPRRASSLHSVSTSPNEIRVRGLPDPLYVQDERTYHIPRGSRDRDKLGPTVIALLLVVGVGFVVSAVLLLAYWG